MDIEMVDSLALACRVCLQCNSDSNSLFDEVQYDEYIKLTNVFKKVTMVEVLESEVARPTHICQECTERLLSAYEFLCAVEKAEEEIEHYLNKEIDIEDHDELHYQQQLDDDEEEQVELKHDVHKDVDTETTTDADIQEIEILDEEFLTEQELVDINSSNINEIVVCEEAILISESPAPAISDKSNTFKTVDAEEGLNLVGSRLSKRTSGKYKCNSCQRTFAKIETLERHIKIAHTVTISKQAAHNSASDERISCHHCPQFFKRRNNYVRHLMACHSKEAEKFLTPEDKELVKSKQNYKRGTCPHCGESFTQASLIIHIRRHTGENPYQCDQCEKAFPRRQDLTVHQRQHTGERPHVCVVCGKSFSRANKLARHMRIHTGERPYKCTKCERSFTQSNDLKIHMRRHTGEKPYKCSVCSEAFICGAALKTHRRQKNHHTPADDCEDPFETWRVCKRKIKTNITQTIQENKEEEIEEEEESSQVNYKTSEELTESDIKMEIEINGN